MLTIATVLKLGSFDAKDGKVEYKEAHVRWLKKQIEQNVNIAYKFVCLTDSEELGDIALPLKHNYLGWWSKIELFRPEVGDDVLYFDLDTVICGCLDRLALYVPDSGFSVLRNFAAPKESNLIGSAVMRWKGDYSFLYRSFSKCYINKYTESKSLGDQGYIQDHVPDRNYIQDDLPGCVIDYRSCLRRGGPGEGNKVVAFYGKRKPWDKALEWVPRFCVS